MTSLGFENYAEALKIYLSKYREVGSPHPFRETSALQASLLQHIIAAFSGRTLTVSKTQSTRGENQQQQRPSSGGFGATGATSNTTAPSTFAGTAESANNILGEQQTESSEHDSSAYGGLYSAQVPNNGPGGNPQY